MADTGNTVSNGPVIQPRNEKTQDTKGIGSAQKGSAEQAGIPVSNSADALAMVTVDGVTVTGDGASHPLKVVGGGGGGTIQAPFTYTTSLSDTDTVQVPFPIDAGATAYVPVVQFGNNPSSVGIIAIPAAGQLHNQITVNLTSNPGAGVQLNVLLMKAS